MSYAYDFNALERKWQDYWEAHECFRAANPGQPGSERPKFYVLDFFPYPSGAGLHVGHPLGYIASDIIARHMRMRGCNVLHPMGWDAFGLPAEQFAVETGVHPRITTQKNIETYKRQLRMIGLSYDWDRELATCEPAYYRWTQWIFLKIYNSWYDPEHRWTDSAGRQVVGAARPIDTLPIPPEVKSQGPEAVERFRAEHRLAYLAEVPVNWCPALGTVLANEEVTADGRSERGNHPVVRRPLKQWMLRITEYADRLLRDLDALDWPEPIKLMQRNWIGRSEGAYVDFCIDGGGPVSGETIRVFTTRPDTLYGATYMVLAPEHRLVPIITTAECRAAVDAYVQQARQRSDLERTAESKKKTGVFTGAYAINPVNRQRIPIWVADYVLIGYGTGSIMAVPGHDTRDLEFAEQYGLDVVKVVEPPVGTEWRGFVDDGVSCNSPPAGGEHFTGQCVLNGLPTPQAKRVITEWLEACDLGEGTVQYKLRDWLFSRQRYWGEPFPVLYAPDGSIVPVPETDLPVTLPDMDDFRPTASDDPNAEPQTPLSRAREWVQVRQGERVLSRETNTMPQWAGSCWYYLRFCDPHNEFALIDREAERYWLGGRDAAGQPRIGGVDLYMGGAEHAVLHLLYARFWHKVLYDLHVVSTPEPFHKLFNQGMIQAYAYRDDRDVPVSHELVEFRDEQPYHRQTGKPLKASVEKMSKSLRNVVNPDAIIHEYGADTLRLYEMYMGPLDASKPWNTRDIIGVHRFLQRIWRLVVPQPADAPDAPPPPPLSPRITGENDPALERLLHKTIKKVTEDFERFAFNTAIAQLIVWSNEAGKAPRLGRSQVERFLLLLAPMAPHICEELWQRLGHERSLSHEPWPTYDPALARDETAEYAIQVNGKIRARVSLPADASQDDLVAAAKSCPAVAKDLSGKAVRRVVVVPGRLVNIIL
ncbi:MAG: leucine--tRNA ligase [Phycisphaerales bacterium]|nr:leucine--tRNA ligase [Phycisphaerales bacterium]